MIGVYVVMADGSLQPVQEPLTRRKLFAAMALQGLLAYPSAPTVPWDERVALAVRSADALIAELDQ